jgi:hypothetical protein
MVFPETRRCKTVEARVMPVRGGMFKGYVRLTTKRGDHTIQQIGRGCGRPMPTAATAPVLAQALAKPVIGL